MKSPARRTLRFDSVDAVLTDARLLVAAEREGRLDRAGNWTLGQILNHVATWADFAFIGYPPQLRAPLPVRIIGRVLRRRILTKGMMAGMKIGNIPGGTAAIEDRPIDQAMAHLQESFSRLATQCPPNANPIFGPLTHDQWIQLNLRHAELHFSFLIPK